MKFPRISLPLMIAACVFSVFSIFSINVFAGNDFMDDDDGAKMARLKAKQRHYDAKDDRDGKGDDDRDSRSNAACGSLNLGNMVNQRGARAPREVNIIVTGDVINANNKCR